MAEIEITIKTNFKTIQKVLKSFFAFIFIIIFSTNLPPKTYEKVGEIFLQKNHAEISAEKITAKK